MFDERDELRNVASVSSPPHDRDQAPESPRTCREERRMRVLWPESGRGAPQGQETDSGVNPGDDTGRGHSLQRANSMR